MIKQIDAIQLKKMLDKKDDFTLIDCREEDELIEAQIAGAIHMPLSNFTQQMNELKDKNKKIVIFCRGGVRSDRACQILEDQGFTDLANVEGGIMAWLNEGYDIIE